MDKELREAYSEIYYIISVAPSDFQNKISDKFKKNIDAKRDKDYNVNIDMTKPLSKQNLKPETKTMLAMMYYNYWSADDNEKAELSNKFRENERKYQKQQEAFYFKNNQNQNMQQQPQVQTQTQNQAQQMQQQEPDAQIPDLSGLPTVYKDKWYYKFKNFFKRIFKK